MPFPDPTDIFVNPTAPREPDAPITLEAEVVTGEVTAEPANPVSSVRQERADAFVAMVEAGESPTAAAKALETSLSSLGQDPVVQAAAKELLKRYRFTGAERRELTRARLNEILLTGKASDSLAAAKQIADDPETGMAAGQPQQNINIGIFSQEVHDVFKNVGSLPGFDDEVKK